MGKMRFNSFHVLSYWLADKFGKGRKGKTKLIWQRCLPALRNCGVSRLVIMFDVIFLKRKIWTIIKTVKKIASADFYIPAYLLFFFFFCFLAVWRKRHNGPLVFINLRLINTICQWDRELYWLRITSYLPIVYTIAYTMSVEQVFLTWL